HVFAETPAERGRSIRQLKAINEILGHLSRIKQQRAAAERAKEKGSDPFYARVTAGGPVPVPGCATFTLLADGLEDLPGDAPPGPVAVIVTPPPLRITALVSPLSVSM